MRKKINIEFIGMPGSGKTFFQKLISNNKDLKKFNIIKNNFKILNKKQKLLFILLFILKYPVFFYKTIYLLYISKEPASLKRRHSSSSSPPRRSIPCLRSTNSTYPRLRKTPLGNKASSTS